MDIEQGPLDEGGRRWVRFSELLWVALSVVVIASAIWCHIVNEANELSGRNGVQGED